MMKDIDSIDAKLSGKQNSRLPHSNLLSAGLAAALACGLAAQIVAHDSGDGEDDGAPGGSIDGSQYLNGKVALQPTDAAPAGASGKIELESRNRNGVVTTKLEVKTYGLTAGDYLLSAVRKSDGSSVDLGTITIGDGSSGSGGWSESEKSGHSEGDHQGSSGSDSNGGSGDHHDGNNDGQDSNSESHGHDNHGSGSGILASETKVPLPAELDPLDIAQLILADASGTPLLVADLTNVDLSSSLQYKASVNLQGAEAVPTATGKAAAVTSGKKGKRTDRFTLTASRLPANTTFSVMINGQKLTTATSNKKGKLLVRKLAANNLMISSVRLVDDQGRVAAKARF